LNAGPREYIQDIDAVESKGIQTTRTERRNGANNKTNWVIRGEELGHESREAFRFTEENAL